MPNNAPFPIRYRFAALTAGLLFAGVIVFGGAAHLEVRRSALGLASERLTAITTQIAQLYETSTTTQRSQVAKLAADSAVQSYLKAPADPRNMSRLRALPGIAGATRSVIATQLWDTAGRLIHTSKHESPAHTAADARNLVALLSDDTPAATGWLRLDGDSLTYAIVARSQAGETVLGYVLQWRRLVSSDREREQLSGLIGSKAVIHLGNTRGDLWTDMRERIEPIPIDVRSIRAVRQYAHGSEGAQLAYALPVANTPWTLAIEFPLALVLQPATRTLQHLALVALALLLVGAATAWIAGHRLTRPIAELAAATKDLSAGNYARRVPTRRRDELGALAEHFNQMAGALERGHVQIEEQMHRLQSLRTIDLAILGTTDLRILLNSVLKEVMAQLRGDAAVIFLFNPHTLTVDTAVSIGYRTQAAENERVRLGDGVAGKAARERRTIAVPDLSEVEMSERLRQVASNEGIRSVYAVPLIAKGQVIGVLDVLFREQFTASQDWLQFCEALAGQAAMAIDSCKSFEDLQRSNIELALAYDTTIEGWSRALDLRDKETEGHTQRVAEMTLKLAHLAGMTDAELVHVKRGALLHDIGKMGVPDAILLKPGKLTDDEWELMRMHPTFAYELLSPIQYLRPALDIPYAHHEKWDGTGYPRGLRGAQIPWAARLFAVIDVWDALRSDRPYRQAWPEEKVREHVRQQSGTHFDPEAVALFLRSVSEFDAFHPVSERPETLMLL